MNLNENKTRQIMYPYANAKFRYKLLTFLAFVYTFKARILSLYV